MSWGDIFGKNRLCVACVKVTSEYLIGLILQGILTRASTKQKTNNSDINNLFKCEIGFST